MSSSKKPLRLSQNGSFASTWHYILPLMQMVMSLPRGIHLAILFVISMEESMKAIMLMISIFFNFNVYASNFSNPDTTPLYFCQNDLIQAHIFRTPKNQNVIFVEKISPGRAPAPWLEESVSELTNKTHTVYMSDDLILKIIQDDSGFMPGILLVSKSGESTPFELNCQLMYKIKNPR